MRKYKDSCLLSHVYEPSSYDSKVVYPLSNEEISCSFYNNHGYPNELFLTITTNEPVFYELIRKKPVNLNEVPLTLFVSGREEPVFVQVDQICKFEECSRNELHVHCFIKVLDNFEFCQSVLNEQQLA